MLSTRKKIMLVDDDESSRKQGRAILRDKYEVYPLPSAHKLFEILEVFLPDLILLDIQMPVVDGFKILERLKKDDAYAKIPVIFLTASKDKESVVKGSALGAAGFVTKPFSAPDLVEHIEKCLGAPEKRELPAVEAAPPASAAESKGAKPVILAIDDAPDVLKSVHSMLRDSYKVYTLPKPEKLHDFLQNTKPDLFLLDYQMPGMSGFDLIPVIREHPELEEAPIIFLTSEGTIDHLTTAVGLGASDFIVKPFDMDVLREKMAKWLG